MPDGHFENNGVLNNVLLWLGYRSAADDPTLPPSIMALFMRICRLSPIYTALTRIDYSLVEASLDPPDR